MLLASTWTQGSVQMWKSIPQPDPWGVFNCEAVGVQKQSVSKHVYSVGDPSWVTNSQKAARMLRAPPGEVLHVLRGGKIKITSSILLT